MRIVLDNRSSRDAQSWQEARISKLKTPQLDPPASAPSDLDENGALAIDESEISKLYRHHFTTLTTRLRHRFGAGPPEPEDIAQQAFERLLARNGSAEIENKEGFLWQTAKNLVFSALRRVQTREACEYEIEQLYFAAPGGESGPSRVNEVREQLSIISACLRTMSEKRREAFVMHRVHGMSQTEIAHTLGIRRSAVMKRVAGALAEIDAALEDHAGTEGRM
ncbi:MAG: RNA polymerase sigma factor [Pseudomonadota bacterium]